LVGNFLYAVYTSYFTLFKAVDTRYFSFFGGGATAFKFVFQFDLICPSESLWLFKRLFLMKFPLEIIQDITYLGLVALAD